MKPHVVLPADPFIQAATNTQSYNRYSYTFNNPLNATDPSGYLSGSFKKSIDKYAGVVGSLGSGVSAQLNGGNFGNGFVTSLASSYLDGKLRGSTSSTTLCIASASIIGGTVSKVTGGKFVSGAATSAISEASGELGEKEFGNCDP